MPVESNCSTDGPGLWRIEPDSISSLEEEDVAANDLVQSSDLIHTEKDTTLNMPSNAGTLGSTQLDLPDRRASLRIDSFSSNASKDDILNFKEPSPKQRARLDSSRSKRCPAKKSPSSPKKKLKDRVRSFFRRGSFIGRHREI